ncbi:MAG: YkgJ family cysteine cluster protein [Candidatus Bathyarchaeia archaeon]
MIDMLVYPLNGEPCLRNSCSRCCHETGMLLTKLDINVLVKLGYRLKEFAVRSGQNWKLRNLNGVCFFLKENRCKIYKFRPFGCRLYPLVYDPNEGKIKLDEFCPYRMEFKVQKENINSLLLMLKYL